ncbi:epoxyqueuosine reductase [Desulfuromonas carbonis]|uniref:epoxyqueuosine reductase n=1 Tax=Desulfuromonas sp. DDH964 TaxID=1823759 RepID=UPI00078E9560|nr:epoxyqueuosine reductase [Desulfuromonas sp. DDH964]AMV70519.1 iron-sulfur cluster-binding oxidoreductase [Desulfuromonas sp. DDH964]
MLQQLIAEIERFVREHPANLQEDGVTPYFEAPLVGVAAAADSLFVQYKEIVGDFHLTPDGLLPGATAVLCWVLPVVETTRLGNRREQQYPSRAWARTRDRGEAFNVLLRRHLVELLTARGFRAVATQLSPLWQAVEVEGSGPSSNWSERHAAFAAGLGTFSLNDGLITAKGIAHRLGSIVTDAPLPSTPRPYSDFRGYCLRFVDGSCGACIARCPVGALSDSGHDKFLCRDYVYGTVPEAVAASYDIKATGCGLCQTKVPCEGRIPRGAG